jgi:ubiquinone/menaquinone biosynthesis C-methylase UbiE
MNYDNIAPYYDTIIGDRSFELTFLQKLIDHTRPGAKTVLDIGCGTGEVMKMLSATKAVTGLDQSSAMLHIAAEKVPSATILQGDMTDFDLGRQFDVVLCTRDSISQLMELSQWQQVFACVVRHLANGGAFIFDYSSAKRLNDLVQVPPRTVQMPNGYIEAHIAKAPRPLYNWEVDIYLKQPHSDDYTSIHELVIETAFPLAEVMGAAESYFMESVEAIDQTGGLATEESDRIYCICR